MTVRGRTGFCPAPWWDRDAQKGVFQQIGLEGTGPECPNWPGPSRKEQEACGLWCLGFGCVPPALVPSLTEKGFRK